MRRVTIDLLADDHPKDGAAAACIACNRPGKWLVGNPKAKRRACGLHLDSIATTVATVLRDE